MKNFLIIGALILVSCSSNKAEKPDNLISEQKMVEILYELSLINSSRNFRPVGQKESIKMNSSFFDYHGIDSLQFAVSNAYYATQPKRYLKIVELAEEMLENQKDSLTAVKKTLKIDTSKAPLIDSKKQSVKLAK